MSNFSGEGLLPTPEKPTPEQLEEFSRLTAEIIATSRNVETAPIDPEEPEAAFALVHYDLSPETDVMIGRNNALIFAPDTVDISVSNDLKRDPATKTRVTTTYRAAYSVSRGDTGYEEKTETFVKGRKVRSEEDIKKWALIQEAGTDEFVRLIQLTQEELLQEDSELARKIWETGASYSQEDQLAHMLTRERLEIMLEVLRYIQQHPELERVTRQDLAKMAPSLLADIAEDLRSKDDPEQA